MILIADRNRGVCDLITAVLSELGYVAACAHDAAAALEKLVGNAFDVALIDLRLPGLPATAELTARAVESGAGVVIMTAAIDAEEILSALPYPKLRKPFRIKTLHSIVTGAASRRRMPA